MSEGDAHVGYDSLIASRMDIPSAFTFLPNAAYDAYHRIHKVLVGEDGGAYLHSIARALEDEEMPQYLDVAGWAFAESSLVRRSIPVAERLMLLDKTESCWQRTLDAYDKLNARSISLEESIAPYRVATNLAFLPLMKSIIEGDVSEEVRERVFGDVLAIAHASATQRKLASKAGDSDMGGQHMGFIYECTALLSLLYLNDPRYIPIPSPARSDTGYDYPEQTHDIIVINQHWGEILKVIPVEIKSKASLRDVERYKALIVRGKMHLSIMGKHSPEHTLNAFSECYEGVESAESKKIVEHTTVTICDLLRRYQQGDRLAETDTVTRFHDRSHVANKYPELSLFRSGKMVS